MLCFICENCNHIQFTNKSCLNCENKILIEKKFTEEPKLISYTKVQVGFGKFLNSNPYTLVILELETGFKILTKLDNTIELDFSSKLNFSGLNSDSEPIFELV